MKDGIIIASASVAQPEYFRHLLQTEINVAPPMDEAKLTKAIESLGAKFGHPPQSLQIELDNEGERSSLTFGPELSGNDYARGHVVLEALREKMAFGAGGIQHAVSAENKTASELVANIAAERIATLLGEDSFLNASALAVEKAMPGAFASPEKEGLCITMRNGKVSITKTCVWTTRWNDDKTSKIALTDGNMLRTDTRAEFSLARVPNAQDGTPTYEFIGDWVEPHIESNDAFVMARLETVKRDLVQRIKDFFSEIFLKSGIHFRHTTGEWFSTNVLPYAATSLSEASVPTANKPPVKNFQRTRHDAASHLHVSHFCRQVVAGKSSIEATSGRVGDHRIDNSVTMRSRLSPILRWQRTAQSVVEGVQSFAQTDILTMRAQIKTQLKLALLSDSPPEALYSYALPGKPQFNVAEARHVIQQARDKTQEAGKIVDGFLDTIGDLVRESGMAPQSEKLLLGFLSTSAHDSLREQLSVELAHGLSDPTFKRKLSSHVINPRPCSINIQYAEGKLSIAQRTNISWNNVTQWEGEDTSKVFTEKIDRSGDSEFCATYLVEGSSIRVARGGHLSKDSGFDNAVEQALGDIRKRAGDAEALKRAEEIGWHGDDGINTVQVLQALSDVDMPEEEGLRLAAKINLTQSSQHTNTSEQTSEDRAFVSDFPRAIGAGAASLFIGKQEVYSQVPQPRTTDQTNRLLESTRQALAPLKATLSERAYSTLMELIGQTGEGTIVDNVIDKNNRLFAGRDDWSALFPLFPKIVRSQTSISVDGKSVSISAVIGRVEMFGRDGKPYLGTLTTPFSVECHFRISEDGTARMKSQCWTPMAFRHHDSETIL